MQLLYALLLTIFIEAIAMFALTRSSSWVFYNLLCNLVTNPTLNVILFLLLIFYVPTTIYYAGVIIGEILVLFAETLLYKLLTTSGYRTCFLRSLITNLCSFLFGLLLLPLI